MMHICSHFCFWLSAVVLYVVLHFCVGSQYVLNERQSWVEKLSKPPCSRTLLHSDKQFGLNSFPYSMPNV